MNRYDRNLQIIYAATLMSTLIYAVVAWAATRLVTPGRLLNDELRGPVTIALSSPRRASVTASSSAVAAARAVSIVGSPGLQFGCRPITTYSAESGTRPDFSARLTISGPIPAQSPSVIPMRRLFVLMLLFVIVLEFAQIT